MASIAWHDPDTKRRIEKLVQEVEGKSSAEIVVTVKPSSGSYRTADVIFGSLVALVGLCLYVYAPIEFTDDLAPPSIVFMFFAGMLSSSRVPAIRRLFSSNSVMAANTRAAAREAFVDQNISCTRDRTGILIYVSTFEKRAEVVADIGIIRREADGQPGKALAQIENTLAQESNLEVFEESVRNLGLWLAESLPPRIDDTNELSDEVNVS